MKKFFSTILIGSLLWCSISFAEWVSFIDDYKFFGDDVWNYEDESIKKDKDYTYVWIMQDFTNLPKGSVPMSVQYYIKINCKLMQYDYMEAINYRFPLGTGESRNFNYPEVEWRSSPPGSVYDQILKVICSK